MPRAPNIGDWLQLFALTAMWGSAFLLNEVALNSMPPSIIVGGRIFIATVLMVGYLRLTGDSLPRTGRAWGPMLVLALLGNVVPFHLIAWAQLHLESSVVGVLMAVMPLFVLTLAHFLVPGARLTPYRAFGFVAGFSGVVVIIGPDFSRGVDSNLAFWSAVAALGAALSYSISTIYARRLGAGNPVRRSAGMLIMASALSLPVAFVDLQTVTSVSAAAAFALLLLGLFTTGIATLLYFRIVQGPGPAFLSLVNYLVPGWAVVAGATLLDETVSPSIIVGLLLILFGVAFSEVGPRAFGAFFARRMGAAAPSVAREDA